MKATMARKAVAVSIFLGLASLIVIHGYGDNSKVGRISSTPYYDRMYRMQSLKASLLRRNSVSQSPALMSSASPLLSNTNSPRMQMQMSSSSQVYHATDYGADPTGKTDSTDALLRAISDAFQAQTGEELMSGIADLGGAEVHLDGGSYMISRPLQLPATGGGNLLIHGGSLRASADFPKDGYLIELSASSSSEAAAATDRESKEDQNISLKEQGSSQRLYTYEDVTLKNLLLDCNFRGGAISVINSLRTTIDNCYISHFATNGILVRGGHETYIRNSWLGQHITAGGDPGERNFSGTAINLMGNDNAVTDVVIFSAAVGVMVSGQANILTGVHCYNKATGFGGTGIYLKLPGLTQTRIVNCYMDYTGIVAEDPVQLHVSNTFFLGDVFILFKSVKGVLSGVNIVDNMFSGSNKGISIVQLDQSNGPFRSIDQVVVDRNNVRGMAVKATLANGMAQGNGSSWTVDFNGVLLFPDRISHVQYTLSTSGSFPNHALRNVSRNRVVVESNVPVSASVYVTVDQS
ncbi:PREDICTED: polygalacturonase QRT3 isoform X2 [Nelumbo nucifera]|uniref:Polygalacturonase QRT3 isoform X2 n=1 Tax=Nelumbo nucifera TaxID=4432 RepID=A0A1U8Q6J7_NELNU|nr:PREDICTED: polygalacturonase QRT3 isoform X2 [Nelumbo nucifera]